jgi:hypothetical protein
MTVEHPEADSLEIGLEVEGKEGRGRRGLYRGRALFLRWRGLEFGSRRGKTGKWLGGIRRRLNPRGADGGPSARGEQAGGDNQRDGVSHDEGDLLSTESTDRTLDRPPGFPGEAADCITRCLPRAPRVALVSDEAEF